MKIKKNDLVVAISGKNAVADKAGKPMTGKILQVLPEKGRAIVEGFNLMKRHMRKSQDNPKGGIVEKEMPMGVSKLMLFCPECKKGVRAGLSRAEGARVRKCKQCGHAFDA
jgi:large subunit ribosomal protein L24